MSTDKNRSGLAWHTDDQTLRAKFEEFGAVEEAVSENSSCAPDVGYLLITGILDCCQG